MIQGEVRAIYKARDEEIGNKDSPKEETSNKNLKWAPPPNNYVKINIDTTFKEGKFGMKVICKDSKGLLITEVGSSNRR